MLLDVSVALSHERADRALNVKALNMPAHRRRIFGGEGTEGALDLRSRFLGVSQLEVLIQTPTVLECKAAPPALVHVLVLEQDVFAQGLVVLGKLLAEVTLLVFRPDVGAEVHWEPAPGTHGTPPQPLLVRLLHVVVEDQDVLGGEVAAGALDSPRGLHVHARVVIAQCLERRT